MSTKSVKVTVLAFVYVPLNLATSIFGMNIQQLNGSGQKLWVFFATAVAALLITGGSWLCSNCIATHRSVMWYRERAAVKKANDKKSKSQEYGLLLRIAMLVWLVRDGHLSWMWKTGAWAAILTNSNTARHPRCNPERATACDYVSKYNPRTHEPTHYFPTYSQEVEWSTPLR